MDLCITNYSWKNSITDIQSDTQTSFPSDHFPVHVKINRKLAKPTPKEKPTQWKSVQINGDRGSCLEHYNKDFLDEIDRTWSAKVLNYAEAFEPNASKDKKQEYAQSLIDSLNDALKGAAKANLTPVEGTQRKFTISDETSKLFDDRQHAKDEGDHEKETLITKQIRKSINKDRTNFYQKNFEEELWFDSPG